MTLFELSEMVKPAEELLPKPMRELLFAGLILSLEDAVEREHPEFDEQEYMLNPDGGVRTGTPYWQAHHRMSGMQSVLYMVRNSLATHEEYLIADRERTNASWSEREIECARHQDVCPRCTETSQAAWKARRDVERAERVAKSLLEAILLLRYNIAKAAEAGQELSAAQIGKALDNVVKAAERITGPAVSVSRVDQASGHPDSPARPPHARTAPPAPNHGAAPKRRNEDT